MIFLFCVMYSKFLQTINKHGMLTPNSKVLVALSGGADSVLMLRLLCRYREDFGLTISAAHLNHCLRGEESDRDELFVKDLCEALCVPLEIKRVDLHAECKKSGEGCEECGRRLRYEFFNSLADDDTLIATAHNLDDRVETFIMNLIRGTALNGLCSISPKRDNVIRPLIDIPKADILSHCETMGYDYVTDSTNLTDLYRRNQIRHNILPYFFDTNPSFEKSAVRMFESLEKDNAYLSALAEEEFEKCRISQNVYCVESLKKLPVPLLNRLILLAARQSGASPENRHLEMIEKLLSSGGKINLPGDVFVICHQGKLEFVKNLSLENASFDKKSEISASLGENLFSHKKILLKEVALGQDNYCKNVHNMLSYSLIDCGKIYGNLIIRNRREGDKITLTKRRVTKTLKKLFCEEGLSLEERQNRVVLCDSLGVVFVEGFGPDKRVAIDDRSSSALQIDITTQED